MINLTQEQVDSYNARMMEAFSKLRDGNKMSWVIDTNGVATIGSYDDTGRSITFEHDTFEAIEEKIAIILDLSTTRN